MADIRFVIMSDLHFGAENSLMTSLTETTPTASSTGFTPDRSTASPVLEGLLTCLGHLTEGQATPATLVLAGDVLDLALSPDAESATVFCQFARLAFGGPRPLFAPVVYYLPGNHDHHMWEVARESAYVEYLLACSNLEALRDPLHVTGLRPDDELPHVPSRWMNALLHREVPTAGAEVRVIYPNMALQRPGTDRTVVVSHGHFTESIYSLMSQLKDILFPNQRLGRFDDIKLWEAENFAWIDFLWGTLGRSGQVGFDLGFVYADLSSVEALDGLVANITAALLAKGKGPSFVHPIESRIINGIFRHEANRVARSERGTPGITLTPKGKAGLRTYLEGPVCSQVKEELQQVPGDLSFVYGHTHKPFVERWTLTGFPGLVDIRNTGGWVVDTASPDPAQGGVVVLVDDDLDVTSLQFYRQSSGSSLLPVQVLEGPAGAPVGPFCAELTARIDPAKEPWASFTASVSTLAAQRHRLQAAMAAVRGAGIQRSA
jgi:Calcineurin-like phosphoesterase